MVRGYDVENGDDCGESGGLDDLEASYNVVGWWWSLDQDPTECATGAWLERAEDGEGTEIDDEYSDYSPDSIEVLQDALEGKE